MSHKNEDRGKTNKGKIYLWKKLLNKCYQIRKIIPYKSWSYLGN